MRILYITDALAVWGGIERVLSDKMNYLVREADDFYRGKVSLKESDLRKAGIKGFSYYGHQDKYGNVTFDPKEIIVKKRTTDPAEIREWIRRQVKIRPEFYKEEKVRA